MGAYGEDSNRGSAYIFTRSGTTWTEQQKLTASDSAAEDYFGSSAALDGDTALVGADHDNSKSGSAYIFTRSGTTWTQLQKLTASDGVGSDYFGHSIALDGDTALVGAYGDDSRRGSAYIFTRSGGAWSQQQKLTLSDGEALDYFGISAALNGDTALVGATGDDDRVIDSGSAGIFTRSGGVWTQTSS